jgi:hypothetical protein
MGAELALCHMKLQVRLKFFIGKQQTAIQTQIIAVQILQDV